MKLIKDNNVNESIRLRIVEAIKTSGIKQIDIAKTPYEKLERVKTIFKYIESLIKFNEGEDKEIGAEEIDPVLIYILIKAHPLRIYTDVEFIRIFIEKKRNESMLTRVANIYNSLVNYSIENFE